MMNTRYLCLLPADLMLASKIGMLPGLHCRT